MNALISEQRLSDWIESFRKDVECTFGMLKGRFRSLQTGVRLESIEAVDKLWLTCCAFHNFLLEEDGLADQWSSGVPVKCWSEDWLGELGEHDPEMMRQCLPFAVDRMTETQVRSFGNREHELQSIAAAEAARRPLLYPEDELDALLIEEEHDNYTVDAEGAIVLNTMSHYNFRGRRVEHFDILH